LDLKDVLRDITGDKDFNSDADAWRDIDGEPITLADCKEGDLRIAGDSAALTSITDALCEVEGDCFVVISDDWIRDVRGDDGCASAKYDDLHTPGFSSVIASLVEASRD
jgi:hypothetical protein